MSAQPETAPIQPTEGVAAPVLSRDEARAKIFGAKPSGTPARLFGVDIELREPPIGEVLDTQASEDRKRGVMMMLIRYCYLPSGEQLFEEADIDGLLTLPFGQDFRDVNLAIQKMLGVMPEAADKSVAAG